MKTAQATWNLEKSRIYILVKHEKWHFLCLPAAEKVLLFILNSYMNRPKRIQFWGEDENDDSLVVEVIDGKKTATVSKADEFYESDGLWCINHQVIDEQAQCG